MILATEKQGDDSLANGSNPVNTHKKLAEGVGFVPKIAIFWANISQFIEEFKYTPRQFCLTRLYNLLTLLLTVPDP